MGSLLPTGIAMGKVVTRELYSLGTQKSIYQRLDTVHKILTILGGHSTENLFGLLAPRAMHSRRNWVLTMGVAEKATKVAAESAFF